VGGKNYDVFIKSFNANGESLYYSLANSTPYREPDAPTFTTLIPSFGAIQVGFAAPLFNGGDAITAYTYSVDGGNTYIPVLDSDLPNYSFTADGLTNGQSYMVYLKAMNRRGYSVPRVSVPVIPFTVPDAPRYRSLLPDVDSILVDYEDPLFNGGKPITSYSYSIDGETYIPVTYDDLRYKQFSINGLTTETAYTIYLKAFNVAGESAPLISYQVATLAKLYRNIPSTITYTININNDNESNGPSTLITPGHTYQLYFGNTLLSTFIPTDESGLYTYVFVNASVPSIGKLTFTIRDVTVPQSPITITSFSRYVYSEIESTGQLALMPITNLVDNKFSILELTNGTSYIVFVKAYNIYGNSFSYSFSSTIPFTVPDQPRFNTIVPLVGSIQVGIADPAFNGGNAITRYDYSVDGGNSYTKITDFEFARRSFLINGLTNGTPYTIYLKGYNARGNSSPQISLPVIPFTVPQPPVITALNPFDRSIQVFFTETFNGGNAVTSYEYSYDFGVTFLQATVTNDNSFMVSRVVNGQPYYIYLRAKNARGYSDPYVSSVITPQIPRNPREQIQQNRETDIHYLVDSAIPSNLTKSAKAGNTYALYSGTRQVSLSAFTPMNDTFEYVFGNVTVPTFGNTVFSIKDITNVNVSDPIDVVSFTALVLYEFEYDLSYVTVPLPLENTNTIHVPELINGQRYDIFIKSVNTQGDSVYSATSAIPYRLPDPPVVRLIPNDGSIDVSFPAPFDGGRPILYYSYAYTTPNDGQSETNPMTYTQFESRPDGILRIDNLTNGVSYTIYVKSTNIRGDSVASISQTTKPFSVPFPTTIYKLIPSDTTITVFFTEPDNGGNTITDYLYSISTVPGDNNATYRSMERDPATNAPYRIDGLTNFTQYSIRLKAVNARGNSLASVTATVNTSFVPDSPIIYELIPQIGAIDISFSEPYNGGNPIIDYIYSINDSSYISMNRQPATNDIYRILDLMNGTPYSISIQAVNIAGNSVSSNMVTTIPFDVPDSPYILSIVPSSKSGLVTYSPPEWNGGNTITGYRYSLNSGPFVDAVISPDDPTQFTIDTTPTSVYQLANGTQYLTELVAVNARGNSLRSIVSSFIPRTVPDTPTKVTIKEENRQATVRFTVAYDGGNAILGHTYSLDGVISDQLYEYSRFTITGLENGRRYQVGLYAKNDAGYSIGYFQTVVPYTIPDKPVVVSIIPDDSKITLAFAGYNGGRDILTTYSINGSTNRADFIRVKPADLVYDTVAQTYSFAILELQNGTTYSLHIQTINTAGFSPISETYYITPYTISKPPEINRIVPGIRNLTVFFTPNPDDGGNTITQYEYAYNSSNGSAELNGVIQKDAVSLYDPSFVISSLTYGIRYSVSLRAVNYAGNSEYSNIIIETPRDVPFAPTLNSIVSYDQALAVFFTKGEPRGTNAELCKYYVYDSLGNVLDEREIVTDPTRMDVSFDLIDINGAPLRNGFRYGIDVQNRNSDGYSELSNRIVGVPCKPPLPPIFLTNLGVNQLATITFEQNPDNGGADVTDILVSFNGPLRAIDKQSIGIDTTTLQFGGLRNKNKYILQLYAVNPAGISDPAEITVISYAEVVALDYVKQNSTLNPNGALSASRRYAGVVGRSGGNTVYQ
jgi:titin